MTSGLFGLRQGNRDFEDPKSWGKNVFTNSFPVALACYMAHKGLDPVLLEAESGPSGLSVAQELTPLSEIFGVEVAQARFLFETSFSPHSAFTSQIPEKSDLVVADSDSVHTRALEIKLTTIPDSASAGRPHEQQSCEIVLRPLMIEQLAVSICASYGTEGRQTLNELLNRALTSPNQMPWANESAMKRRMGEILSAVQTVIAAGVELQQPMVLHPIWRTVGQTPVLEDACFDLFVWSNLALATMIWKSATESTGSGITRPQRSLVWLVKMLWDYSAQAKLDRADTFESITYNSQTDKAASFSGAVTIRYLKGPFLSNPRVPARAIDEIILGNGGSYLSPERRLDASVFIQLVKDGVKIAPADELPS